MKPRLSCRRTIWGVIATGLVLSVRPVAAIAGSMSLAWDPNTEGDLAGYKVYIGTSPGTYTLNINVGHVTAFAVSGLADGQTYYGAVTAYDIFGNESGFSNEVSTTLPEATTTSGADSSGSSIQGGDPTEDPVLTSDGSSSGGQTSSGDTACGRGKSCDHSKRSKSKHW